MSGPLSLLFSLVGTLLILAGLYPFFRPSEQEGLPRAELMLLIQLVGVILGLVLLRLAYVLYFGLSRSEVF